MKPKIAKYSKNVWFSPRYFINIVKQLKNKDSQNFLRNRKYQKEREAWIASVAILGINKITGQNWWLQIPIEDPPDIEAMTIVSNKIQNKNIINSREIEVMEITKHQISSISEEIQRKLENKRYVKETCLLAYLRRTQHINDLRLVVRRLKELQINIADIWMIGNVNRFKNDFILAQLYPDFQTIQFNIEEEMEKIPKGDFVSLTRAKGTEMIKIKPKSIQSFKP